MKPKKVQRLAAVIDRFEGTRAVKAVPKHGAQWAVHFEITSDLSGVMALEFVVWAIAELRKLGRQVSTRVVSPPPVLNGPGRCLRVWVEGSFAEDAGEVAKELDTLREELWFPPVDEDCRECGSAPSLPLADDEGQAVTICPDCFADPDVAI